MTLEIQEVDGRRGTARFIDVAWKVQAHPGSLWIPPLTVMVADALDRKRNPFYAKAARALLIAVRDGRPVGRVAAIHDRYHIEHFQDRVGFFECEDDVEAASGLFSAASRVLRYFRTHGLLDEADAHGMLSWRGSGGFSIDASIRIEGEDRAGVNALWIRTRRTPVRGSPLIGIGELRLADTCEWETPSCCTPCSLGAPGSTSPASRSRPGAQSSSMRLP